MVVSSFFFLLYHCLNTSVRSGYIMIFVWILSLLGSRRFIILFLLKEFSIRSVLTPSNQFIQSILLPLTCIMSYQIYIWWLYICFILIPFSFVLFEITSDSFSLIVLGNVNFSLCFLHSRVFCSCCLLSLNFVSTFWWFENWTIHFKLWECFLS